MQLVDQTIFFAKVKQLSFFESLCVHTQCTHVLEERWWHEGKHRCIVLGGHLLSNSIANKC